MIAKKISEMSIGDAFYLNQNNPDLNGVVVLNNDDSDSVIVELYINDFFRLRSYPNETIVYAP